MSGTSLDAKASAGLANSLSNVFKLADVTGLCWVRYVGPNSTSLEAPKDDPVLNTYAKLLNEGYACSWRRLSPCTDGQSGEAKDLWLFYFTDQPDISSKLAEGLQEEARGNWKEEMTTESTTMLYRALHNLIERSLLNESFLPLGKWFARPDSSLATDGSSRGCFLCSFSFFVHAHLYVCASVDMRAGPALQPLLPCHVNQALASSTGLQVILSPSGLNAVMTGHSYNLSDAGIDKILEEWKLFYPRRFNQESSLGLPAAIEVVIGGVRMRYPSQFVLVYHSEDSLPTPPPSPLAEEEVRSTVQEVWEASHCVDTEQQYREATQCHCQDITSTRSHSSRRQSSQLDPLPLKALSTHPSHRYEPYSRKPRELPASTPGSLSLMNTPQLNAKRKLSKFGLPKYSTTPVVSPSLPPSSSPLPGGSSTTRKGATPQTSLPTITLQSPSTKGRKTYSDCPKPYDQSRISKDSSRLPDGSQLPSNYCPVSLCWLDCLPLPGSMQALAQLQLPRHDRDMLRLRYQREGLCSVNSPVTLSALLSPRKTGSPSQNQSFVLPSKMAPRQHTNVPQDNGFDPSLSAAQVADSPMSVNEGDHLPNDPPGAFGMGGGVEGGGGEKKPGIDVLLSATAVKIDNNLDQIFEESDEEDEGGVTSSHLTFLPNGKDGKGGIKPSRMTRLPNTDPIPIPELSKIYPTPPSVEDTEKRYDENDGMEERESAMMWDGESQLEDEVNLVPVEFAPLPLSPRPKLPKHCVYVLPSTQTPKEQSIDSESRPGSSHSGPQKFIFPPPTNLTRSKIESLTLPLSSRHRSHLSPHMLSLTSSPSLYPHAPKPSNQFHPTSGTTATPSESPFDLVTPTPVSVSATANRLIPVLPEAHALYVNLALLDSALGTTLSEPLSVNTGGIMMQIQNFINLSSRRLKLDSVADSASSVGPLENSTTGLFNFQEEKPVMTFGITDYPSLGFREDLVGTGPVSTATSSWTEPYGALSHLAKQLQGKEVDAKTVEDGCSFPLVKFLQVLQDYSLHLCLTTDHSEGGKTQGLSRHAHLMGHPSNRTGERANTSCRLYHSHSVISTILSAKQLVTNAARGGGKKMATPLSATKPPQIELSKQENSASWILDLLTLPRKFIIKRLKELRSVLQHSFHTAPCLKFSTKGPLTLKDLQQLAASHTALGDDCIPLPLQPMMVGHDHEWLQVSPLAIPAWDKLMLEPYAMKKTILYLILTPPSSSSSSPSPSSSSITPTLLKYFQELSIIFRNCNLGQHLPLEKGVGKGGVLPTDVGKEPEGEGGKGKDGVKKETSTADPCCNSRHGPPATPSQLETIFKKKLIPFLASLPTTNDFISEYTPSSDYVPLSFNQNHTHLSIVIYVVCRGGRNSSTMFQIMHMFSEMLENKDIPELTRNMLLLQPLECQDLLGPAAGHSGQLRSLAFSIYSRTSPTIDMFRCGRSLTFFGPIAEKQEQAPPNSKQTYAPPYVLSPAAAITHSGTHLGSQIHQILFSPEESVLFCGYCVSPDHRWLLAVCCDRQGEFLDSTVIGIQPSEINLSRKDALQKLWAYITSIVASSVLRWNIVITRFGKPSISEIRDWPMIVDDGLLEANQLLRSECEACTLFYQRDPRSTLIPKLLNVMVVSVQPERNIQLYPTTDPLHFVSHVMVLPQDHRAEAAVPPCMTPGAMDDGFEFAGFPEGGSGGEMMGFQVDDSIFSALDNMDALEPEVGGGQVGMVAGSEDTVPKAVGYLISTSPPGYLPEEFWGYEKPQSSCSMFKVSLHLHNSEKAIADSPQETLGSVLLCFNALSWLTIDQSSSQRRTCLPLYLHTLSHLHHLFSLLQQNR